VPVNDALDVRQPDAGALELLMAVQTLKDAEQLSGILRIKTGAVVTDENDRLPVAQGGTDFDFGIGAPGREFHRIGDQITSPARSQSSAQSNLTSSLSFTASRYPFA
jgi:hypothetical protein